MFSGKFDSSTIQGKLKVGKTYNLTHYGWRVPFLSWYENIVGVVEVEADAEAASKASAPKAPPAPKAPAPEA